jgi:hypothetical protein
MVSRSRALAGVGIVVAAVAIAVLLPGRSAASQLVGVNASSVSLVADGSGRALVSFRSDGSNHQVLAWGAVDARSPSRSVPQVEFQLDTRGGSVRNSCTPVRLPLAWFVAACRASDGSYWGLQSWQRLLPNGGARPSSQQAVRELRLSHWTGQAAELTVRFGWSYHRYLQLYGTYRYRGKPVFGYRVASGVPLDGYGRNLYVDAFNSDVGTGWKRVNSFLAHSPLGGFCYGFYPHGGHTGTGKLLRATIIGPGVTPDVMWQGAPPAAYSPDADSTADADLASLLKGDPLCRPN